MNPLENSESKEGKNEVVLGLAKLAKEVLGSARKDVNSRLDEMVDAFSGVTDPEADSAPYVMEAKKVTAVVNLIRTLFGLDPLEEGNGVDLTRDLTHEKNKASLLNLGEKKVSFKDIDFSSIKDEGDRVVKAALSSIAMQDGLSSKHCWDWVNNIYKAAGIKPGEVVFSGPNYGKKGVFDEKMLVPGAWVYYHNGNKWDRFGDHSGILESYDPSTGKAFMLSFPGPGRVPRRAEVNLKEQAVQRIQIPKTA